MVDAQAHLRESVYGLAVSKMLASGRLVIHSDAASLPGSNHPPGVIQGMTAKDGTIHLVAPNLTHDTATAVLLHEAFHSGVRPLIGDAVWNRVLERVELAAEREAGGLRGASDAFWGAALTNARITETPYVHFAEEVAAYAIEHRDQAPAGVRDMVDRVIGAVQAWLLRRFGIQVGAVSPAELRSLAVAALRNAAVPPQGVSLAPLAAFERLPRPRRSAGTSHQLRRERTWLVRTEPLRPEQASSR